LKAAGLAWTPAPHDFFGIPVPINILGRITSDATQFRAVKEGTRVRIIHQEKA
jgi:hypothetical protein